MWFAFVGAVEVVVAVVVGGESRRAATSKGLRLVLRGFKEVAETPDGARWIEDGRCGVFGCRGLLDDRAIAVAAKLTALVVDVGTT